MKRVYMTKLYDEGNVDSEYFYVNDGDDKIYNFMRNLFYMKYVRNPFDETKNYTITDVDIVEDVNR